MLAFSICVLLDSQQGVLRGVIRGMGFQQKVLPFVFVSYWLVGVPMSYLLSRYLRVAGLFLGFGCGNLVNDIINACIIFRTDWKQLAQKVSMEVQEHKQTINSST